MRAAPWRRRVAPAVLVLGGLVGLIAALLLMRPTSPPTGDGAAPVTQGTERSTPSSVIAVDAPVVATHPSPSPSFAAASQESPEDSSESLEVVVTVVSADDDKPLVGARVERLIHGADPTSKSYFPNLVVATVLTDVLGRATLKWTSSSSIPEGDDGFSVIKTSAEGFETRAVMVPTHALGRKVKHEVTIRLAQGASIEGRVLAADGTPVVDAVVGYEVLKRPGQSVLAEHGIGSSYSALRPVRTDADGHFELMGLTVGETYSIPVRSETHGYMVARDIQAGTRGLEIRFPAGAARLYGRLLDAAGQPVAKGIIAVHAGLGNGGVPSTDLSVLVAGQRRTITASDGSWELRGVPPGRCMVEGKLTLSPRGLADHVADVVTIEPDTDQEVTLRLPGKRTLNGIVRRRGTTQPVANFGVWRHLQLDPRKAAIPPDAVSAADGRLSLEVTDTGGFSLTFDPPDGMLVVPVANANWKSSRYIHQHELDETIVIEVDEAVIIRGRVVEQDRKTPVVDERVVAGMRQVESPDEIRTNGEGRFEISVLPGAPYTMEVITERGTARHESTAPSRTDEASEVLLVVTGWASVSGHVRTQDGDPVEGIMVRARVPDSRLAASMSPLQTETNSEGYYYLEQVPSETVELGVEDKQGSSVRAPLPVTMKLEPGEYRRGVDFTMMAGFMAEGIVVDEEEQPVQGALVWLRGVGTSTSLAFDPHGRTDAKGLFRLGPIPEDATSAMLQVSKQGFESLSMRDVSLLAPMRLRLKREQEYQIEVIPIPPVGAPPISRIRYRMTPGALGQTHFEMSHAPVTTTPPGDAVARVAGPPRAYRIDVMAVDESLDPVGLAGTAIVHVDPARPIGETIRVELLLAAMRTISGRVVDAQSDLPLPGITVQQSPPRSHRDFGVRGGPSDPALIHPRPVITDEAGAFALTGLFPGPVHLEAHRADMRPGARLTVEVPPDHDVSDLVLKFSAGSTIFGRIIGPTGTADGEIQLIHSQYTERTGTIGREMPVAISPDGSFRLEGLDLARHTLRARVGSVPDFQFVDIKEHGDYEVNFDFSRRVLLTGTITVSGLPWDSTAVRLYLDSPQGEGRHFVLNKRGGGGYEALVEPGDIRLRLTFPEVPRAYSAEEFTVPAEPRQQQRDFNIELFPIDIVLVFPSDDNIAPGVVDLHDLDRDPPTSPRMPGHPTVRDSLRLPPRLPGRYRAEFESTDGRWRGSSEDVTIGRGLENVIVVTVEPTGSGRQ